jgi:hypothetical protein
MSTPCNWTPQWYENKEGSYRVSGGYTREFAAIAFIVNTYMMSPKLRISRR